jgi:hypothetical protein
MKRKSMWLLGMVGLCLAVLVACKPQAPPPQCFRHKIDQTALTYALCTDKGRYRYGEAIPASFTLTNTGDRAVTLNGGDKPALELQLTGGTWTDMSPAPATQITLEAGAAYTIEGRWIPEQAYLEDVFRQERPNINLMTIYAIIRLKPGDVRDTSLSVEYLPDKPAPVPTKNELSGHCAGEQRSAGDLELQICTDKREYQFGETVQVRWQIRNISNEVLTLDGGEKPAMDIYITEWIPASAEGEAEHYAEEHWSDTHPYETQIQLEPGGTYLIEWQWPTTHTNLAAVLTHRQVPGENVARVSIFADYALQPDNRWSFIKETFYGLEDNQ